METKPIGDCIPEFRNRKLPPRIQHDMDKLRDKITSRIKAMRQGGWSPAIIESMAAIVEEEFKQYAAD
jgi:hypothetical protein